MTIRIVTLQKLSGFVKTHWFQIYLFAFLLVIVVLNIHPGYTLMGLDNASPYFGFTVLVERIVKYTNFFEYGGLLYLLPFSALSLIHVPAWLISHLVVWGAFVIGIYLFSIYFDIEHKPTYIKILFPLFVVGNLITIWIFAQPILLFVASFAGIPAALLFVKSETKTPRLPLLIGLLYFLSTSINPIAFVLYLAQVTVLAWLTAQNKSKKSILKASLFLVILWLCVSQTVLCIRPQNKTFVLSELQQYISYNQASSLTQEVTTSLRTAEMKNNSLLNVARFATGWLELNDINGTDIFAYSRLYATNYGFILLGLLPFMTIVFAIVASSKYRKDNRLQVIAYGAAIFATSTYLLLFVGYIPFIREGLRWISSKTWPSLFTLGVALFISSYDTLIKPLDKNKKLALTLLFVCVGVAYGFPWFLGQIVNRYSYVQVPEEYSTTLSKLKTSDVLLVYPKPQKLFFRSFVWGYYGTDFLAYISKAHIVDGTSIIRSLDEYKQYIGKSYYYITEDPFYVPESCSSSVISRNNYFTFAKCEPSKPVPTQPVQYLK